MRKEFEEVNNKHYSAGRRTLKLDALLLRPATDLVHIVAIALVLGLFGIDALKSPVEVGVLYAFVNYIHRFFQPVNEMMMKLSFSTGTCFVITCISFNGRERFSTGSKRQ